MKQTSVPLEGNETICAFFAALPLVTFELPHPLVANVLTSKGNIRETYQKVLFFCDSPY